MTDDLNARLARLLGWEYVPGQMVPIEAGPGEYWNPPYWHFPEQARGISAEQWRPAEDLNQMAMVEAEIGRRGLQREYTDALLVALDHRHLSAASLFALATASAAVRARAAITVLEESHVE